MLQTKYPTAFHNFKPLAEGNSGSSAAIVALKEQQDTGGQSSECQQSSFALTKAALFPQISYEDQWVIFKPVVTTLSLTNQPISVQSSPQNITKKNVFTMG